MIQLLKGKSYAVCIGASPAVLCQGRDGVYKVTAPECDYNRRTVNIKNPYEQLKESKQFDYVCKMRQFGENSLLSHFPYAIYLPKSFPQLYYLLQ